MPPQMTRYDEIPYKSAPFPQTRPDRLEAIARLFGLQSPPSATARVLELGCGAGANLLGMAHDYPNAHFVGIDASARQIADGWTAIQGLGLRNIDLRHLDIAEIGEDFGEFDYIICHGVYSWVPPAIQGRILEILRRNLADNGVGYVSYNTYPGWHIRGIVRDMMRYHGTQFPDPATQLAQAKALVQFVVDTGKVQDSRYKQLLRDEFETINRAEDSYLHHEHLEENNQPLYFHEFAQRLGVNGLQFLGEAEFSTMVSTNFAPEIGETLRRLGTHDILQMEQYMDFVRGRYFRQSLICKRSIVLNRILNSSLVKDFWLSSNAAPVRAEISMDAADTEEFKIPAGAGLNCRHPLTKAAFLVLHREWPGALTFDELYSRARAEAAERGTPANELDDPEFLANDILSAMAAGLVEWRVSPPPYTCKASDRPKASKLAQHQASTGFVVTNLRGEMITLDLLHRQLLRELDGSRDREALTESLAGFIAREGHVLRRDGDDTPVTEPIEARQVLRPAIEKALANLSQSALLLG